MRKRIFRKPGRISAGWRRRSSRKFAAPVAVALLFFLLSVFSWLQFSVSSEKQAEKYLSRLYSVRRDADLADLYESGIPGVYDSWEDKVTETGKSALESCGLPYVLLFQDFSAEGLSGQVERTYVRQTDLSVLEDEHPDAEKNKSVLYRYEVEVAFYLEKGLNVLAPVSEAVYSGQLLLEKDGWFGWKLAFVSVG